jgi:hypothetical protein
VYLGSFLSLSCIVEVYAQWSRMAQSYLKREKVRPVRGRTVRRIPRKPYGEWVGAWRLKHVRDGQYERFADWVGRERKREA